MTSQQDKMYREQNKSLPERFARAAGIEWHKIYGKHPNQRCKCSKDVYYRYSSDAGQHLLENPTPTFSHPEEVIAVMKRDDHDLFLAQLEYGNGSNVC